MPVVGALAADQADCGAALVARLGALHAPIVETEPENVPLLRVDLGEVAATTERALDHRARQIRLEQAHPSGDPSRSMARSIRSSAASIRLACSSLPARTMRGSPAAS